jgi:hypothetical protein
MAGGLLNLIAVGSANLLLTGNPTKTFFKVQYSKYTNFGLQKFRIDFDGARDLRLTEQSKFTFKIKRYADLLMDTYLVLTLPDIWSPIYNPTEETDGEWSPYEFKWIDDLGAQIISEIEIQCGAYVLQRYSGQYLSAMIQRDFTTTKKDLFNRMSGNIPELNDPANNTARSKTFPYPQNKYPSAFYTENTGGAEPSIRGREIYVPINSWFSLDSKCAFPLISLQYNELIINVTLRSIQDMFQVRDVFDSSNNFPYVRPDFNQERFQMYRFLQTPPAINITQTSYTNQNRSWNANVHLLSTYCFLSKDEQKLFAAQDQVYLVKDIFEYDFQNITGSSRIKLPSSGMVANWMFYLQRSDVNLRNEWSNYSNWSYTNNIPSNSTLAPLNGPGGFGIYITGDYSSINRKEILESFGVLLEGDYRENTMPNNVFNYVEKYARTHGSAKDGIYCYNFCLNTNPFEYQPSGAINLSRFKNIELEISTYLPPVDSVNSNLNIVCDDTGQPISVSTKPGWALYLYNYNIHVFEERYNILSFIGGNCGLMYAR